VLPPVRNAPGLQMVAYRDTDYAEIRFALLTPQPGETQLTAWRPGAAGDLAVMMAEWFAYLGEILTFYNERIANEMFLRTAVQPASVQSLIRILGYRPNPGVGASVTLGALLQPAQSFGNVLTLPKGLQFQSKPSAGQTPQIFELSGPVVVAQPDVIAAAPEPALLDPAHSSLNLAGAVSGIFGGDFLLLRPRSGGACSLVRVGAVTITTPAAGPKQTLLAVSFPSDDAPTGPAAAFRLDKATQSTGLWTLGTAANSIDASGNVHLSGLVRAIKPGDQVLFTLPGGGPRLCAVNSVADLFWDGTANVPKAPVPSNPATSVILPHTVLGIAPKLPASSGAGITMFYNFAEAAALLDQPAPGWPGDAAPQLLTSATVFPPATALPVLIADATGAGFAATAQNAAGNSLAITGLPGPPPSLRTPLSVYFNLLAATRGQSVSDEVLGSGNPNLPNQSFTLAKSPLTYLRPAAALVSTLAVTVNGQVWSEVANLFNQPPGAQVFVTLQDAAQITTVMFGDGVNGARLPAGVNNVVASYRFGSGAAAPPAGALTVIAKPFPGLRALVNPVGAAGGADPDPAAQIATYAPRSVLTFGRAISAADFEAIAAVAAPGTRVSAVWGFDEVNQRGAVTVFVAGNAATVAIVRNALAAAGDPNRPVAVTGAKPIFTAVEFSIIITASADAATVQAAVASALADPVSGLFGAQNLKIGQSVFDSQIAASCAAVPGVRIRELKGGNCTRCRRARIFRWIPLMFLRARRWRMDDDFYAAWYTQKLWALLPGIYRTLDSPDGTMPGPLQEFVARLGGQAAVLRRSFDRLLANQSIETCDDWVIPYIGDLLATRIVSCLPARAQRLDVAKTIYYRRRAGTLGLIEELASDIAGHDARAVEFFRRLGRTRHNFDPPIGLVPNLSAFATPGALLAGPPPDAVIAGLSGPYSRTPAGGFADLRNVYAAGKTQTAFDEFSHTADFRAGRQSIGWQSISHLGVFVWWLYSYNVSGGTPVEHDACPGQFTFDPTGREIPLFAMAQRSKEDFADNWVAPNEWELSVPITQALWKILPVALYPTSLSIAVGQGALPPVLDVSQFAIAPESGRFRFLGAAPVAAVSVVYNFGFSSNVGAGTPNLGNLTMPAASNAVSFGEALDPVLTALAADATIGFADSTTYPGPTHDPGVNATPPVNLAFAASPGTRPVLRWKTPADWTLTGHGGDLTISGLWLAGGQLVIAGKWNSVTLQNCTLDPGSLDPQNPGKILNAIDGVALNPVRLAITGAIGTLALNDCITGPILVTGKGNFAALRTANCIIQSITNDPAIAATAGAASFSRTTILGRVKLHELAASECIFDDVARVDNSQAGCVRFSTLAQGHNLHAPYRCATVPAVSGIFDSRAFGRPDYARLSAGADAFVVQATHVEPPPSVLQGAANGAQPGAFCAENQALIARGLAAKLAEYMPANLIPVWVDAVTLPNSKAVP
jgi:uncharacterized phage protein gp47/JayE